MKRLFVLLLLIVYLLEAKPCMTDIYFGNGVWNTEKQAIENMKELRKFMQYRAATPLLIEDEKNQLYSFKYAYNPSRGTVDDLVETYWQLYESGQISDGYFASVYLVLAGGAGTSNEAFLAKLRAIINIYNNDANAIYQPYYNASFSKNYNVLLVAHSQGNLLGNKIYSFISDQEKARFRMVSVATPANHVMMPGQTSPYVTAVGDPVISAIPNALEGNVDGIGHEFIPTYLNGSIDAPGDIALHVKTAYNELSSSSTCGGYSSVYMKMFKDFSKLKIFGSPTGANVSYEIGDITLDPYNPPIEKLRPDGSNYYICSEPQIFYGNLDYFNGDMQADSLGWKPGDIYDKTTLEIRKNIKVTITSSDRLKCADVDMGSEIYDIVNDALDE